MCLQHTLQHTATHRNTDAPVALTSKMPSSMVRSDTSNVPPPRSKISTYLLSFSVFFTFLAGSSAAFAAAKHTCVACQKGCWKAVCLLPRGNVYELSHPNSGRVPWRVRRCIQEVCIVGVKKKVCRKVICLRGIICIQCVGCENIHMCMLVCRV